MISGKMLLAKKPTVISGVYSNVDPTSRWRFTRERATIPDGTAVACVFEYTPVKPVLNGKPTTPYYFVLYKEKIWEAVPHDFFVVENPDALTDKVVCFTGQDDAFKLSREYWKSVVEAHGGSNRTSGSKSLSFLVVGKIPGTTTKLQKAKENSVPCISYSEFSKLLISS